MNTDETLKNTVALSKNEIVKALGKPQHAFTKADIIEYVANHGVEFINFMYSAADGRLKTLNFVINDLDYLQTILSQGERVDGSSLFDDVDPANSDLYVLPRFNTAFVDPFSEGKTVVMLCSFFDQTGQPLATSPENTLRKAADKFENITGMRFYAMGELEYYVIGEVSDDYPAADQHGYHESSPYAKFGNFRMECMRNISAAGGRVKYGHSEVGNFTDGNMLYEQNEIEFLPVDTLDAADQLMVAKWIIRTGAAHRSLRVTFAPKITRGKAGSGLHIHMQFVKDGKNMMLNGNTLSNDAKRGIAGMMTMAKSLTAFGNMVPTSYFRLVPHQEAPTDICWGDHNRSVLVRVPLGWTSGIDMCKAANPDEPYSTSDTSGKQTIEIRSGDCSANIYLYLAALTVACTEGWRMPDALDKACNTYVAVNIHGKDSISKIKTLDSLPKNCQESAEALEQMRGIYEADGVFSSRTIDSVINRLKGFDDADLSRKCASDNELTMEIVNRYFHCG